VRELGNSLLLIGLAVASIGLAIRFGLFGWFGKLPGDIRIEGKTTSFFAPISSMILLSLVASVILNFVLRIFRGE